MYFLAFPRAIETGYLVRFDGFCTSLFFIPGAPIVSAAWPDLQIQFLPGRSDLDFSPYAALWLIPGIIATMRECIRAHGGEIHFQSRVTDFLLEGDRITGARIRSGDVFRSDHVILAADTLAAVRADCRRNTQAAA